MSVDPSGNSVGRVFSHQERSKAVVKIGDRFRWPPRGRDPNHPLIEDLQLKDFLAWTNYLSEELACSADFIDRFQTACEAAAPFVRIPRLADHRLAGKRTPIPRVARAAIDSVIDIVNHGEITIASLSGQRGSSLLPL